MITLYGIANSRAFRCLWMLEDLECDYEHVPVDFSGGSKQPDYLKLNPNGRIPCLVDDDLVLFESLAINLYLARRYSPSLWPQDIRSEARTLQWSFWSTNELDGPLSTLTRQGRRSEQDRDADVIEQALGALKAPLRVLDDHLSSTPFLLGKEFGLADLNTAAVASALLSVRFDLTPYPHVKTWLSQCMGRPAAQRAIALFMATVKP